MSDFLAVDGEQLADNGPYIFMGASNGRVREHLENTDGLPTARILDWLLELAAPGRRLVCYGLGYDVNHWLKDVPWRAAVELWRTGETIWKRYLIRWVPGRWFTVKSAGRTVRVTEVLGFFQTAFVNALEDWGLLADQELREMKNRRKAFKVGELPRIRKYCLRECDLLVALMERLEAATVAAGCKPREWIGSGALAGAMLANNGVGGHHAHDQQLLDDVEPVMRAYFGGRVEAFKIGSHYDVHARDLNSAYPWAATFLPSLEGAELRPVARYDAGAEHALWNVTWADAPGPLAPFPVRNGNAIYYPRNGSGIYHAVEVTAALACGYDLTVGAGWTLHGGNAAVTPGSGSVQGTSEARPTPFHWVPGAYSLRRRWERAGHPGGKALKLALNSMYGKLAQGHGYNGGPPRWQSYFWAGELTARVRARMLTELHANLHSILAVNTDGVYVHGRPAGHPNPSAGASNPARRLGGWRAETAETLFVAQPGLYVTENAGVQAVKSRGHFQDEVDYHALREGFQDDGWLHVHHYSSERFYGLGTAALRRDKNIWRKWLTEPRSVSFYPTRKLAGNVDAGELLPPAGLALEPSEPYIPKASHLDTNVEDNVQAGEQPCTRTL